ncbi:MAG TPA: hypothetical protein VLN57_19445 [Xanthobacteraceae bacterium]|nr:hypothetical protein [Xanthobacteraceae bacterium]
MILLSTSAIPLGEGWSLLDYTSASGVGAGSIATTSPIDTTDADLLVAVTQSYSTTTPMIDSKSNIWLTGVVSPHPFTIVCIFYCHRGIVGIEHSFTWYGDYGALQILAFKGSAANPADQVNSEYLQDAATIQPGSIIPSQSNSLIVSGCCNNQNVYSIDSGFEITNTIPNVGALTMGGAAAYLLQPDAVAVNPTWTIQPAGVAAAIMSFTGA